MNERGLAPPTGMPPPVTATLPDGVMLELRPLAREIPIGTYSATRGNSSDTAKPVESGALTTTST